MYEVIGTRKSRAMRVIWMLEELGVPYSHTDVSPRSDAVAKLNPSGKIPVLRDGDAVLTDSVAIMTYLADKHQKLTYAPGTTDRARQDAFTHQILDEVDALLWTASRHSFVLPKEHRVPGIKDSLRWEMIGNLDRLATGFTGPFLMGEKITVPDILLTHCLGWALIAKFDPAPPSLRDYTNRLRSRPAFVRAQG
ncbi:MAG: glutathione S-transferase family protein [Paracoccaceae bacterium]